MRFVKPKNRETRTVKRFAWYPMDIDGVVYWLETITVVQVYDGCFGWVNRSVINNE